MSDKWKNLNEIFDESQYYRDKMDRLLKNTIFQNAVNLMHKDMVFLDLMFQVYLLEAAGAHHMHSELYIRTGEAAARRLESFSGNYAGEVEEFLAHHSVDIYEYFSRIEPIDNSYYKRNGLNLLFMIVISERRFPTYNEWRVISPVVINLFHSSIVPVVAFILGIGNPNVEFFEHYKFLGYILAATWAWIAASNASIIRQPRYHAELELRRVKSMGKVPRSPLHFSLISEIATGTFRTHIFYLLGTFYTAAYSWWEILVAIGTIAWIFYDLVGYFFKRNSQPFTPPDQE